MRDTADDAGLARQWAGAAAVVGGFLLTGLSSLPEPPLLHPERVVAWWGEHPPVVVAVSLLRVGGLVCSIYWLLLCSAVIVFSRSGHLLRLARVGLPGLGRAMKVATGGSLLGVAVIWTAGCATNPAHSSAAAPSPPELVPLDNRAAPATPPQVTTGPPPQAAPPTSTPAGHEPVTREPAASTPPSPPAAAPATTVSDTSVTSWTVRPGEDLWSITESVLIARLGHVPDQRQVAALWLRVIDANRSGLPDPANPNLIFAGDIVMVPA